jgi:hypothetical protein
MITGESVAKACSEVGEYTDEHMVSEFDRFFRAQPAVCEFIVDLTHESGQKIQELSLFLSYMVFKAVEAEHPISPVRVTPDDIEGAYRETESWMSKLSEAENADVQPAIAASLEHDTEPYLLQYVISELNEPMEDGSELNDEEKGEVFFVLKTIIACISHPSKGKIIEID